MTTCLISVIFLGTSATQAIAADDLVEQCPSVVTEPVCLPDPTTMQQLIGESAVTSSRGKGKISGKKIIIMWLNGKSIANMCTTQFYCFPSHRFMKIWNQIKTVQLLHQYTESFMVSLIYEGLMSSNFMYTAWFSCILLCNSQSFKSVHIIITVSFTEISIEH